MNEQIDKVIFVEHFHLCPFDNDCYVLIIIAFTVFNSLMPDTLALAFFFHFFFSLNYLPSIYLSVYHPIHLYVYLYIYLSIY